MAVGDTGAASAGVHATDINAVTTIMGFIDTMEKSSSVCTRCQRGGVRCVPRMGRTIAVERLYATAPKENRANRVCRTRLHFLLLGSAFFPAIDRAIRLNVTRRGMK